MKRASEQHDTHEAELQRDALAAAVAEIAKLKDRQRSLEASLRICCRVLSPYSDKR